MVTLLDTRRRREATKRLAALTPRESDVLHLVAESTSNAEIGRRLRMAEPTINTYVSPILAKLDCSNASRLRYWSATSAPAPSADSDSVS